MTPAARIQAAIDVLDAVLAGEAAERALTNWARASRFAGSGDRAGLRDLVFDALRCLRSYAALGGARTGRGLMLGALRAAGEDPAALFGAGPYAPAALLPDEAGHQPAPLTRAERLDMPDWLLDRFDLCAGARCRGGGAGAAQPRAGLRAGQPEQGEPDRDHGAAGAGPDRGAAAR